MFVDVPNASALAARERGGTDANDVIAEVVIAVAAASSDALLPTGAAAVGTSDEALESFSMVRRTDAARTAGLPRVSARERRRRARGVGAREASAGTRASGKTSPSRRRGERATARGKRVHDVAGCLYPIQSHLRAHRARATARGRRPGACPRPPFASSRHRPCARALLGSPRTARTSWAEAGPGSARPSSAPPLCSRRMTSHRPSGPGRR